MAAFRTRQEMVGAYDALMSNVSESLSDYRRFGLGRYPLKSYMLEVDQVGGLSPAEAVRRVVRDSGLGDQLTVRTTDDDSLMSIESESLQAMVDVVDSRFWFVHSASAADEIDALVSARFTQTAHVDSMWFTSDFLLDILSLGHAYGFATTFDTDYFAHRPRPETVLGFSDDQVSLGGSLALSEPLEDEFATEDKSDSGAPAAPIQSLNIQMSGTDAAAALAALQDSTRLVDHLTLSKVKVRHGGDDRSTDEVRFDGRTVARGRSFSQHVKLLRKMQETYGDWLTAVETDYRFDGGALMEAGPLKGAPLIIRFPVSLPDHEIFLARLVSGTKPFRMWGLPRRVSAKTATAVVADLHGGSTLRLDVTPDFVRFYLGSSTCANTVLRLLANLQQAFSTNLRITAEGQDITPSLHPRGSEVQ